ncbi:MAG TPA: TetR/AcrR family transcriptional regulator [Thermoleophilaceae bacterium]|nr:TetR/AcrR family transcriptional regulator [Thermoleophilaceae bacterium]
MTTTPWGNADELRARRLSPGPGETPEAVKRNQCERLFGAMVLAVDKYGYEATRVADLLEIAGVSRSAFYKHFADKLDCFLQTIDAAAALAIERIGKAYDVEGAWDARLRAAVDAFVELVVDQPATARLCVVEIYAAGPKALERLDAAVEVVDRAFARAFEESPEHRRMPADLVHALVGGVRKAVHTRLRRGEERQLEEIVPKLLDWALGYRTPPQPLKRPRRRPRRADAPVVADRDETHERLTHGVIATVAKRGYRAATIAEMAKLAGASLTTFYDHFPEGKDDAFLAAIDCTRELAVAAAQPAYEQATNPRYGVRDGIDALFGFLAANPEVARVGFVEAFAANRRALGRGERGIEALTALLGQGCADGGDADAVATEAIGGAIHTLLHTEIRRRRVERVRELTPTATYVALAPFVGPGEAVAIANVSVQRA